MRYLKKLMIIFIFSSSLLFSQWTWQNPLPSGNRNHSVCFKDSLNGWICGNHGILLNSIDGGASWNFVPTSTDNNFNHIDFINSNVGWVFGDYSYALKTTDGGDTWVEKTVPTWFNYLGIWDSYFRNIDTGWVIANGVYESEIDFTTDGGETWQSQFQNIAGIRLQSICFIGDTGWAVGYNASLKGFILKTTNMGLNWFVQLNNNLNRAFNDVYFYNTSEGIISGRGQILRTTNGGESWAVKESAFYPADISRFDSLTFIPADSGKIYISSDEGETWDLKNACDDAWLYSSTFINNKKSVAVGLYGTIIITTDGGQNWSPISSGYFKDLRTIDFYDENIGWAAGKNILLKTTNSGITWEGTSVDYDITSMFMIDQNIGFLGTWGKILKTTDGGSTWSVKNITDDYLFDIKFM